MASTAAEKQQMKEITDRLEAGIQELYDSGKFKAYLTTMSRFHTYSARNEAKERRLYGSLRDLWL